jgi:hypothetical protein
MNQKLEPRKTRNDAKKNENASLPLAGLEGFSRVSRFHECLKASR